MGVGKMSFIYYFSVLKEFWAELKTPEMHTKTSFKATRRTWAKLRKTSIRAVPNCGADFDAIRFEKLPFFNSFNINIDFQGTHHWSEKFRIPGVAIAGHKNSKKDSKSLRKIFIIMWCCKNLPQYLQIHKKLDKIVGFQQAPARLRQPSEQKTSLN